MSHDSIVARKSEKTSNTKHNDIVQLSRTLSARNDQPDVSDPILNEKLVDKILSHDSLTASSHPVRNLVFFDTVCFHLSHGCRIASEKVHLFCTFRH